MLSINTNLSSLIVQSSMNSSTDKLNLAIERMTTGFKINHAKDNAANYSIATNMSTQLNSYQIAQENVSMGMDLVTTASDTISLMQDKAERLRGLATQARNGTYGAQSLDAINTEANAIMAEISRLYKSAQFNGKTLFNSSGTGPQYGDFMVNPKTYTTRQVNAMDSIDSFTDGAGGKYKITSAEDLAKLATIVNSRQDTSNATFVLADDIDLADWQNANGDWNCIGRNWDFSGTFDGNGHVISNLNFCLFGTINNATIKNLGISDANLTCSGGVLAGSAGGNSIISNSYVSGSIEFPLGESGGFVGQLKDNTNLEMNNCVNNATVIGGIAGGLIGACAQVSFDHSTTMSSEINNVNLKILNCINNGNVTSLNGSSGGLIGCLEIYNAGQLLITNCANNGNISGYDYAGGFLGLATGGEVIIAESDISGTVNTDGGAGGIIAFTLCSSITIKNTTNTADVTGDTAAGGIIAAPIFGTDAPLKLENCSFYGTVTSSGVAGSLTAALVNMDATPTLDPLSVINCTVAPSSLEPFGAGFMDSDTGAPVAGVDLSPLLANVTVASPPVAGKSSGLSNVDIASPITLQVGINSDNSCQITFDTSFMLDLSILDMGIESDGVLNVLDNFINQLSEKETLLGAVQNRLESALESISVNIENLASSRSTIRDADIAEVSSHYIQQQILQQTAATLMSTANQSPAIALQLI